MKLTIEIDEAFIDRTYGTANKQRLKDDLWEKICDVLESGDNFHLGVD